MCNKIQSVDNLLANMIRILYAIATTIARNRSCIQGYIK